MKITLDQFMADRGITDYLEDGCVNLVTWRDQKPKILFYLKEAYGYKGCGKVPLDEDGWCDSIEKRNRTNINILTLAAAYFESKAKGRLSEDEIEAIYRDNDLLKATVVRVAYLNIKKHPGESTSNDTEIRRESRANAPLLRQQIEDLSPNIIIAGGNVCWDSLTQDIGLFPHADCPSAQPGLVVVGDIKIVWAKHPARGGRPWIKAVYKCLIESDFVVPTHQPE